MNKVSRLLAILGVGTFTAMALPVGAQNIDYDPARSEALRRCDDPLLHGRVAEARTASSRCCAASDPHARRTGRSAICARPRQSSAVAAEGSVRARVRWGRLFLTTSQHGEAVRLLEEALEIAPRDYEARLAMVRLTAERFTGDVTEKIDELIAEDANRIEPHLVAARVAIENGRIDAGRKSAERALELAQQQRRAPLEAWTLLAAIEVIGNRDPARWTKAALDYNPRYGEMFESLGHFEVIRRRYREADGWLGRAVEVQPDLWSAQRERGLNLLRLGDIAGARTHLERAYSGDRFSTATVNTLRLLDASTVRDRGTTSRLAPAVASQRGCGAGSVCEKAHEREHCGLLAALWLHAA